MKQYLKLEGIYFLKIMIPMIITVIYLGYVDNNFTIKEAIEFTLVAFGPCLLLWIIFVYTTYYIAGKNGIEVYYFGVIIMVLEYKNIQKIEISKVGFGFFASSKENIIIYKTKGKACLNLKNNNLFVDEVIHNKKKTN